METLEVVDEHIGDPEVIEELKGHWVPELGLDGVVCPDSKKKFCGYSEKVSKKKWAASICIFCLSPALLPLDTEVHAHGDGKLLVVDGEDVQDLHINIHIDCSVRDRRL